MFIRILKKNMLSITQEKENLIRLMITSGKSRMQGMQLFWNQE